MDKPFDPTKPVQTRGGLPARLLCTDLKGATRSLVAAVDTGAYEQIVYRESNGSYPYSRGESVYDLINVPERKVETRQVLPNKFRTQELGHFATASNNYPAGDRVFGYLDFITEDGELVDVVFRPKENKL